MDSNHSPIFVWIPIFLSGVQRLSDLRICGYFILSLEIVLPNGGKSVMRLVGKGISL